MNQLFRILIDDPTPLGRWKKDDAYPSLPNDNLAYHVCLDLGRQQKCCFYQAEVQPVSPCPHCQGSKFLVQPGPTLKNFLLTSTISPCPHCRATGYITPSSCKPSEPAVV